MQGQRMKRFINKKNIIYVAIGISIVCIRLFLLFPATVNGASMQPTLSDGQHVFALKTSDVHKRDIVAFVSPIEPEEMYVKRIIGVPGDKIKIDKQHVYVNGTKIMEDYLIAYDRTADFTTDARYVELVVPINEYFVMGDNRFNSMDSRQFGTIKKDSIKGKLLFSLGVSLY